MPTIITAHITKAKNASVGVHGTVAAVIPMADMAWLPDIAPFSWTRYTQARAVTAARQTSNSNRFRRDATEERRAESGAPNDTSKVFTSASSGQWELRAAPRKRRVLSAIAATRIVPVETKRVHVTAKDVRQRDARVRGVPCVI